MNRELRSRHTAYRFSYPEGGYRQYYGRRPLKGPRSPADDRTTMQNEENLTWVPIPTGYTAPHTPEDYIEAANDLRKQDRQCIAYTHPEAQKAFDELNASCCPGDPKIELKRVYHLSKEEELALVSGLEQEEAAYKFKKPWEEGFVRYHGRHPREGIQNAADRLTQIWEEEDEKYVSIPEGYTAPHDPQDYIDALNWEVAEAETTRRAELASAARRAEKNKGGEDWEDWEAPDPLIESDLSGSDYEEARRDLETKRAFLKSRGKPAPDTEEEDEEEDCDMQRELQEEMNSKVSGRSKGFATSPSKRSSSGNKNTSLNPTARPVAGPFWDALKASLSPSELDASAMLRTYNLNLMPNELVPEVETISSQKPSLMESAMYRLFGRIVWQLAARLGHLNSRSSEFVMEKANLLQKEKRAPNRYNVFKTFASRSKPDDLDQGMYFTSETYSSC